MIRRRSGTRGGILASDGSLRSTQPPLCRDFGSGRRGADVGVPRRPAVAAEIHSPVGRSQHVATLPQNQDDRWRARCSSASDTALLDGWEVCPRGFGTARCSDRSRACSVAGIESTAALLRASADRRQDCHAYVPRGRTQSVRQAKCGNLGGYREIGCSEVAELGVASCQRAVGASTRGRVGAVDVEPGR